MKIKIKLNEANIPVQPKNYPEQEEDVYGSEDNEDIEDDVESSYFGIDSESLKSLFNQLSKLDYDNSPEWFSFTTNNLSKKYNIPIIYLGQGAFRATFSIGKDFALKIAKDPYAIKMNEQDYKLGTDSEINNIFPKVYTRSNDFKWILMEKVTEIKKISEFVSFFPNNLFLDPIKFSNSYNACHAYNTLIRLSLYYQTNEKYRQKSYEFEELFSSNKDFKTIFKTQNLSVYPTLEEISNAFMESSTNFRNLVKIINKYNVDISEIRVYNTGYTSNNKFVLIDSSIF